MCLVLSGCSSSAGSARSGPGKSDPDTQWNLQVGDYPECTWHRAKTSTQAQEKYEGVGQGNRQAKPWLQETTAAVEERQLLAQAAIFPHLQAEMNRGSQMSSLPNPQPCKPTQIKMWSASSHSSSFLSQKGRKWVLTNNSQPSLYVKAICGTSQEHSSRLTTEPANYLQVPLKLKYKQGLSS